MRELLKLCRLCTKSVQEAANIFARNRRTLLQRIEDLTGITLKNDKELPQQVCQECERQLEQACNFRERCIESQSYFDSVAYKRKLRGEPAEKLKGTRCSRRVQRPPPSPVIVLKEEVMDIFESEPEMDAELLVLKSEPSVAVIDFNALPNKPEINTQRERPQMTEHNCQSSVLGSECSSASPVDSTCTLINAKVEAKQKTECKVTVEQPKKQTKQTRSKVAARRESKEPDKPKREEKQTDFICDQCGHHYKTYTQFNVHLRKHEGVKPYQCEICAERFYTQSGLTRHMNRHTGNLPIPCRYCSRRFTEYSSRIRHERTHTNERPFLCTQCGKAFTQSYILKNHMLVHTGERSFKCHYCNKTFSRQTHLTTHYRALFHKQNVEKYQQLHSNPHKEEGDMAVEKTPATMETGTLVS